MGNRKKAPDTGLTEQQELFARYMAMLVDSGGWRRGPDCYREAYDPPKSSHETIKVDACKLAKLPAVAARIAELRSAVLAKVEEEAGVWISVKALRIRAKQARHDALTALIEARAESATGQCPGEDTGLLAHDQKGVGSGPDAEIVDVWKLDKAVLDALNDLENDTAKELGQLVTKTEVDLKTIDDARLLALLEATTQG